jgi:hypothetical protein
MIFSYNLKPQLSTSHFAKARGSSGGGAGTTTTVARACASPARAMPLISITLPVRAALRPGARGSGLTRLTGVVVRADRRPGWECMMPPPLVEEGALNLLPIAGILPLSFTVAGQAHPYLSSTQFLESRCLTIGFRQF